MLNAGNREYLDELLGPISQTHDISKIRNSIIKLTNDWKEIVSYYLIGLRTP
jgi:hypothetical protein